MSDRFAWLGGEREGKLATLAEGLRTAPLNLISPRDRSAVRERHLNECVLLWEAVAPGAGQRWIDIGTGGGLPGLVFAILSPWTEFRLIDARAKKVSAVRSFVETLGLRNVEAVSGRAEELARLSDWRGTFDGAVSRGLGGLSTVVELSRGFVVEGGQLWAVRGRAGPEEVAAFEPLARTLAVGDIDKFLVEGATRKTWLVRMRAKGNPPSSVPRSNGLPAARPLGTHGPLTG